MLFEKGWDFKQWRRVGRPEAKEGTEEGNTQLMQKTANKPFASGVVYLQV